MKRAHFVVMFLLLTAAVAGGQTTRRVSPPAGEPPVVQPSTTGPKYSPDSLLVRFRAGASSQSMQAAHSKVGAQVVRAYRVVPGLQRVQLPSGMSVGRALAAYRRSPAVQYAEPDYRVQIVGPPLAPNDPLFAANQWDMNNTGQTGGTIGADIHAEQAWSITQGGNNVFVGVIDTGSNYNHPDLSANEWSSPFSYTFNGMTCPVGSHGFNALANTCDPMDDNGHGTHVSGTIGASGNNGIGVAGVNWFVTIVACKFLNSGGSGSTSDAVTCLEFFKDLKDNHGVDVVATSNSWGGGGFSQALSDAIDADRQSGILFIAAAGNNGSNNDAGDFFPANYYLPNVIAVASTDLNDALSGFSDYGKRTVHVGAPGSAIFSTMLTSGPLSNPSGYGLLSGTSMATPHVTGVAALLKAQDPSRDWRAIKNLILAGGDNKLSLANTITGKRLDANGSLTCSNSAVLARLRPIGDPVSVAVGAPVLLAVLHINCGSPAGDVTVTVNPGGTVILKDDGAAPDQAAGDGIYSGQFTVSAPGQYTVSIAGGETFNVNALAPYFYQPVAFNYRTISGTSLNFFDDNVTQITPGFSIPFGGGSFSSLWVSSNGTVSFETPFLDYFNTPLPATRPATLVAPFWDDLLSPNLSQNVFWAVSGAPPNRELVIEWRNVIHYGGCSNSDTVTFEAVFFESKSDILFNYMDPVFGGCTTFADFGASATIGVQVGPNQANQFSFNQGSLGNNTALLWTTTGPNVTRPVPSLASLSPANTLSGGPDFTLTVNGSNFVDSSVVRWNGSDRPTTFVNSSQLTATILAADIASAGTATVSVFTFDGGVSAGLPFTVIPSDYSLAILDNPQTVYVANLPAVFHGAANVIGAFNSPVDLTCATGFSPPPATCTLAPTTLASLNGGAAFTITASDAAGNYSFNVHAVGEDASRTTHNAGMDLHIIDFSLAAAPNPVNVQRTSSGSVTLTVTAAGSFSDTVHLACRTPLPTGMSCSYSRNDFFPSNAGTNVFVTIGTTASTPLGLALIHLDVTGSSQRAPTKTTDVSVNVTPALGYLAVTPCRVADTRTPNGPFGGPFLAAKTIRAFPIPGSSCGIPDTALAYSVNLTVVPRGGLGFLTALPCGGALPLASNLNAIDGRIKAGAAIVPAGEGGGMCVYANNDTDLVIDINGYFVPATDPAALSFYPLTPCRLVDTRLPNAPLAGPSLAGNMTRTFPVLSGSCNVPSTAQAYSLNYTSVPKGPLGYLTTWPAGKAQPLVSTLNALTGTVTANAAIVPAGTNGDISVFVTNDSDLVMDINGYFAPPGPGGLSLYTLAPCRVKDTRNPPGSPPFSGTMDVDVVASGCGAPVAAQSFVLNATVVPPSGLGFLSLWPQGTSQPTVSTLNALDGAITSNMAIVPTSNGSVSVFPSSSTHLVLDISAFFAP